MDRDTYGSVSTCVYIYISVPEPLTRHMPDVVDEIRRFGHSLKYCINTVQFLAQTNRFVS